jgi:hypothetical protein
MTGISPFWFYEREPGEEQLFKAELSYRFRSIEEFLM